MAAAKKTAKKKPSSATKRASSKTPAKKPTRRPRRRWVKHVTTDSTHPPEGLFKKSAPQIARSLASKKVSPKGPGSGMRMLTYYINRAGKGLGVTRRKELERAKHLLSERIRKEKEREKHSAQKAA